MLLITLLVGGLNLGHAYQDHLAVMNGWTRCIGLEKTEHGTSRSASATRTEPATSSSGIPTAIEPRRADGPKHAHQSDIPNG